MKTTINDYWEEFSQEQDLIFLKFSKGEPPPPGFKAITKHAFMGGVTALLNLQYEIMEKYGTGNVVIDADEVFHQFASEAKDYLESVENKMKEGPY